MVINLAYRNKKLLILLRELPCMNCGAEDGTICAAHRNQGKGMGLKNPDSLVASLCHRCHYELDNGKSLTKQEKRYMWDQAYIKTMQYLIEKEKVVIND
jgi:nitrite reductase/ring-hydroxylating ferredoxin subunit